MKDTVLQITPATDWFAVFKGESGRVAFPLACWALLEDETGFRSVEGMDSGAVSENGGTCRDVEGFEFYCHKRDLPRGLSNESTAVVSDPPNEPPPLNDAAALEAAQRAAEELLYQWVDAKDRSKLLLPVAMLVNRLAETLVEFSRGQGRYHVAVITASEAAAIRNMRKRTANLNGENPLAPGSAAAFEQSLFSGTLPPGTIVPGSN